MFIIDLVSLKEEMNSAEGKKVKSSSVGLLVVHNLFLGHYLFLCHQS